MTTYGSRITAAGAAALAGAEAAQHPLPITVLAVGSGSLPNDRASWSSLTGLVAEQYRAPLNRLYVHPDNPSWLVAEASIPPTVGSFTLSELGLIGGSNEDTLLAVGNFPESYKPTAAEGATRDMVIRMIVEIAGVAAENVQLMVDPNIVMATQTFVIESVHELAAKRAGRYFFCQL